MAYATKYYDYQIAVVFAILLGGLLLLALVVTAIYYICVVNMRGKKGGITRVPSGRSTVRTRMEPQQYSPSVQPQTFQQYPQYSPYGGMEGMDNQQIQQQHPFQQSQNYEPQQQQQQQAGVRVREMQPEYYQQQGPISYTSYPYDQQQNYQQPQAAGIPATYHMSSV